jgi:uridine phosphorylase
LIKILEKDCTRGITVTCGGFYGPQGRILRGQPAIPNLIEKLQNFNYRDQTITNFEMETAGIYAIANLLGHQCCSLSTLINNRATGEFSKNTAQAMENLIKTTLEKMTVS